MATTSSTATFSHRSTQLISQGKFHALQIEAEKQQQYDPITCPNGLISVALAGNTLMEDYWSAYSSQHLQGWDMSHYLKYGPATGSKALREVMAPFFNHFFAPAHEITAEDIVATSGTTSLLENLAWCMFDAGDAVILPTPTYANFSYNMSTRPGVRFLHVPLLMNGEEDMIREFERVYEEAKGGGERVKGVLICNPNNPLGRCYSASTLREIVGFCGRKGLQLISDEIYAQCSWEGGEGMAGWTSALSVMGEEKNVHVVYGLSKDFGMGGLRLGFLVSRNGELRELIRRLGSYSFVTAATDAFATKIFSDLDMLETYFALLKARLRDNYLRVSAEFEKKGISYSPANAGVFLWIDLSRYLGYFEGTDEVEETREMRLCRWLIGRGLFVSPGELSESAVAGRFRFTVTGRGDECQKGIERFAGCLKELGERGTGQGVKFTG